MAFAIKKFYFFCVCQILSFYISLEGPLTSPKQQQAAPTKDTGSPSRVQASTTPTHQVRRSFGRLPESFVRPESGDCLKPTNRRVAIPPLEKPNLKKIGGKKPGQNHAKSASEESLLLRGGQNTAAVSGNPSSTSAGDSIVPSTSGIDTTAASNSVSVKTQMPGGAINTNPKPPSFERIAFVRSGKVGGSIDTGKNRDSIGASQEEEERKKNEPANGKSQLPAASSSSCSTIGGATNNAPDDVGFILPPNKRMLLRQQVDSSATSSSNSSSKYSSNSSSKAAIDSTHPAGSHQGNSSANNSSISSSNKLPISSSKHSSVGSSVGSSIGSPISSSNSSSNNFPNSSSTKQPESHQHSSQVPNPCYEGLRFDEFLYGWDVQNNFHAF